VAQSGSLRAGAAKVDISPTPNLFPLVDPIPFINGGEFIDVHDPLWARALVLDNGVSKVAMISVDSSGIPSSDELIKTISSELKIPTANVILIESRDHNTPWTESQSNGQRAKTPYAAILERGIVEAARKANASLQPAQAGFGVGKTNVDMERPNWPSDQTVSVLLIAKPSGEPIAIYSSYAAHPVVMFRALTKEGRPEISADLAGATSNYVEAQFKGAVAIWNMSATGASGSGTPSPVANLNFSPRPPEARNIGAAGWTKLDAQGSRLGEEIVRVTQSIKHTESRAVLWAAQTVLSCPRQTCSEMGPPPDHNQPGQDGRPPQFAGQGPGQQPGQPGQNGQPGPGEPGRGPNQWMGNEKINIPVSLIMINDIAVTGIAADVNIDSGLHLRHDSIFSHNMLVTWMPTDVGNIRVATAIEPALIDAVVKMQKSYLPIWQAASKQ
jgi:hypothetical protein